MADQTTHLYLAGRPTSDDGLLQYLDAPRRYMRYLREAVPAMRFMLYQSGGQRGSDGVTVAESMRRWLLRHGLPDGVTLILIDGDMSPAAALAEFRRQTGDVDAVVYCEHTRRFITEARCRALFTRCQVRGVDFDQEALRWHNRLWRYTMGYALARLSDTSPDVALAREVLREFRHRLVA